MSWVVSLADVIAFSRGPGFTCMVNLGSEPVPLPRHESILLASGPVPDDTLPPDTAVWLRTF
jgi:alpha-glucosidase